MALTGSAGTLLNAMGVPAGGFTTAAAALREYLLDEVLIVDPKDRPVQSLLSKVQVDGVEPQWAIDSLNTPNTAASIEGFQFVSAAQTSRYRIRNYTQILTREYEISESAITQSQRGLVLGSRNEFDRARGKALDEASRDLEATLIRLTTAAGASGNTRYMKSLYGGFAYNTASPDAAVGTAANSYPTAGVTASGTAVTAFNINDVLTITDIQFRAGLRPNVIMSNYPIKRNMAQAFLSTAAFSASGADTPRVQKNSSNLRSFELVADVIVTDMGRQVLIPNIYMPIVTTASTTGANWSPAAFGTASGTNAATYGGYMILDTSKISLGVFRPFKPVDLPRAGDSQRGYVVGEYTLLVKHPTAIGHVFAVKAF